MIDLFYTCGIWGYFLSSVEIALFVYWILIIFKLRSKIYSTIFWYLTLLPILIGNISTLVSYHMMIKIFKNGHVSLEIFFAAEKRVWSPFYLGLIGSIFLVFLGFSIKLFRKNAFKF